jgi:hypothetical protein
MKIGKESAIGDRLKSSKAVELQELIAAILTLNF